MHMTSLCAATFCSATTVMPDSDSDSSLEDIHTDVSTSVLLGFASKEPTGDNVSQLGGHPVRITCPRFLNKNDKAKSKMSC